MRDRYGTQIRKIQVRNRTGNQTEKIEYEHVQLRFYCEMEYVIYEDWKIQFHDLIQLELLNEGRKIPTLTTFRRYKPRHVRPAKHLMQMVCDDCTEFNFLYESVLSGM